jgi:internalin A
MNTMRHFLLLCLLLCLTMPLHAQDNPTPYEIALQRIQEAHESNANYLSLGQLSLTVVPPEIGQLGSLQQLDLIGNQLIALPLEIGQLRSLETLSLAENQLTILPPEIGLLSKLRILFLDGNQLTELPQEIEQLSNLEWLSLKDNQLVSLPSEIGMLHNVQLLDLSNNQLTSLPPEIGQLSSLRELDLFANQLMSLPPEIGQLNSLCSLDLGDNPLLHLPTTISNINLLTQDMLCYDGYAGLYLDGNSLISPPPEVVEQGTVAVLAYLRNQAWYHVQRLIISAAAGVGLLAMLLLGVRYRQSQRKSKVKRG